MTHNLKDRIRRALTPIRGNARAFLAAVLVVAFAAACDVHGISEPGTLVSITVTPNATLIVGGTQQMVAVGYDAEGRAIAITPTWSVAAGGGTVASAGMFTAGPTTGVFTNTVVASVGSISGQASITVTAGPLATITVVPTPVTLAVTATQQFTAVGRDAGGNIVQFTPTWSVVAGGGTIGSTGIFTAGNTAGTYTNTVQASSNTLKGFATVTVTVGPLATLVVTPNPATMIVRATQQFVAVGKDAGGNILPIAATWSVVALGGTIDGGGLFTAGSTPGTFTNTIKATSGNMSATATVIVTAGPLANITVTPTPATMTLNATQQFTAVGSDIAGNTVVIVPTWSVVALGGTINATSGLFTAGTVSGTFTNTVRASSGTVSGFATVIVTTGPLATITVTPNPVTMPSGTTQQFVAVGRDANNNVFVITPTWAVVNGGGAINSSGLFTAGAGAGTFNNTIQATSGAISGTATVTVTVLAPPPPVGYLANGIMAGQSVTCITGGLINANVAISPGNTITGFGPCVITGVQNLGNAIALAQQNELTTAYNTLAGLPCPPANAIVADLGGTTKPAGVYCTASGIGVTGTLTLNGGGDPNATFVFQAGTSLITAGNIVLIGGAQAKNVYWQVGTSATLGTASQWQGNILALTSITLVDNATLLGRALARNGSVTLGTNNTITLP
ncbi:MAG: ice-binding family protein [Gemmatimonadaceae bacterium]